MKLSPSANFLAAARLWRGHSNRIARAVERLSTGLRVNRAADDASGLSMSERMKAQLRALGEERLSAEDELSLSRTADGALGGMQELLQRMSALSLRAMSDLSAPGRAGLDAEYKQLLAELDRTRESASHGSVKLFGSSLPGGIEAGEPGLVIEGRNLTAFLDGLDAHIDELAAAGKLSGPQSLGLAVAEFAARQGQSLLDTPLEGEEGGPLQRLVIQDGSVCIQQSGSPGSLGLEGTGLLTAEGAAAAQEALKKALEHLSAARAAQGAAQNRLERTIDRLARLEETLAGGISRIIDADMALEAVNLTREQFLSQASALAMAHERGRMQRAMALLFVSP